MPALYEQIGQRTGHQQAMRVLQPAIAHLGKAEEAGELNRRPPSGPGLKAADGGLEQAHLAGDREFECTSLQR